MKNYYKIISISLIVLLIMMLCYYKINKRKENHFIIIPNNGDVFIINYYKYDPNGDYRIMPDGTIGWVFQDGYIKDLLKIDENTAINIAEASIIEQIEIDMKNGLYKLYGDNFKFIDTPYTISYNGEFDVYVIIKETNKYGVVFRVVISAENAAVLEAFFFSE